MSERPVGANRSTTAARNCVATSSAKAIPIIVVKTMPTAPVVPLANALAAGSGPT